MGCVKALLPLAWLIKNPPHSSSVTVGIITWYIFEQSLIIIDEIWANQALAINNSYISIFLSCLLSGTLKATYKRKIVFRKSCFQGYLQQPIGWSSLSDFYWCLYGENKTETTRRLILVWYPISHLTWLIVWPIPLEAVLLDCFAHEIKSDTGLSKQFARPSSTSEIDGLWLRICDSYHSVCRLTGGAESRSWISGFWSVANAPANFVKKHLLRYVRDGDVYLYYIC